MPSKGSEDTQKQFIIHREHHWFNPPPFEQESDSREKPVWKEEQGNRHQALSRQDAMPSIVKKSTCLHE